MALKSAYERFNAIMNGEDIDADVPSIDVEINVIQKEIEAEETTEEMNDMENEIATMCDVIDRSYDSFCEYNAIIDILQHEDINPVALKILHARYIYSNAFDINLPSSESLNHSNIKYSTEAITDSIKNAAKTAGRGIGNAAIWVWNKLINLVNFFIDVYNKWFDKQAKLFKEVEYLKKEVASSGSTAKDIAKSVSNDQKVASPKALETASEKNNKALEAADKVIKELESNNLLALPEGKIDEMQKALEEGKAIAMEGPKAIESDAIPMPAAVEDVIDKGAYNPTKSNEWFKKRQEMRKKLGPGGKFKSKMEQINKEVKIDKAKQAKINKLASTAVSVVQATIATDKKIMSESAKAVSAAEKALKKKTKKKKKKK